MRDAGQSTTTVRTVSAPSPRIPLSPAARRVAAAAALVLGVWVVTASLKGDSPREVTVRVDLAPLRRAGLRPSRVRVELLRGGEPLRVYTANAGARDAVTLTASVPEGALGTHVEVDVEGRVLTRDGEVIVRAGEVARVPAPER